MKETFTYVTTEEEFSKVLPDLRKANALAVDVEFDNKYSYEVVICLIQISTGSRTYLIDPLTVDSRPLASIFEDEEVIKIFFAGIQDIQLLQTNYNWQIRSILDLSTIYQVANHDNQQTSLNEVIEDVLGIEIPKNKQIQSKEDWKQRPLPIEMQIYATRDVIYLHKVLMNLQKLLQPKDQRLLEVYFQQIPLIVDQREQSLLYAFDLCSKYYFKDEREKYLMFKLVQFREQTAELTNQSSGYILSRSILKSIVKDKPTSVHELKQSNLYHGNVKKYGHEILEIIRDVYSKHEEPVDYYKSLEKKYNEFYPYYKYLDYQYNWPYKISISSYKNRRGMLRILKQMLIDRFGVNKINYLYTRYLNHQIARHEEINLFEVRRKVENTSTEMELIDVMYEITIEVYNHL